MSSRRNCKPHPGKKGCNVNVFCGGGNVNPQPNCEIVNDDDLTRVSVCESGIIREKPVIILL